jgi:hypothetical protein
MAKIERPRLANATPEYNQQQIDQIIRTLEQIVQGLNSTFTVEAENKGEAEAWYMARY